MSGRTKGRARRFHVITLCRRQGQRRDQNGRYSEVFRCPVCGQETRRDVRRLGNRRGVYCHGTWFETRPHGPGDWLLERQQELPI
jgi:hypothetical protein